MSNNKQSIKLYTEEEIRKFFSEKYDEGLSIDELIEILTPIELPSDDEIEEKCNSLYGYEFNSHESAFFGGAKWMRDKIQGGDKWHDLLNTKDFGIKLVT